MKKINKQKKSKLVFEIVSSKQSFIDEVLRLRKELCIPNDGFTSQEELDEWKDKIIKQKLGHFYLKWLEDTLAKYKLYPMFYQRLEEYVLGVKESDSPNIDEFCNSFIKDDGRLHIVVNPYASISDVEDYINKNRSKLQKQLQETKKGAGWPLKVKERKNKERDSEIYNLSKKSLKELGESHGYKSILIQRKFIEQSKKPPSSDRIESIIKEQRKRSKG